MVEPVAILVVEDRSIIAAKVRRDLERAGFVVAGMCATVAAAEAMAQTLPIAGAVLDVDLRGEPVFPVADTLRERGIPFLFLTGYGRAALPAAWQTVPLLEKPFEAEALARALRLALTGSHEAPAEQRLSTPAIRTAWDRMRHSRDLVTEQRAWTEQAGLVDRPRD